eukprot:Filipodium_phascolosomae@DN7830_c0_g1_i1.p1
MMRFVFVAKNLEPLTAAAVHFRILTEGWRVDGESKQLPTGYFGSTNNEGILSQEVSFSKKRDWWIGGLDIQPEKYYVSTNTIYTPDSGNCEATLKVHSTTTASADGGTVTVGESMAATTTTSNALSAPKDVFEHQVTVDRKQARIQTNIRVSITTKSQYPQNTVFEMQTSPKGLTGLRIPNGATRTRSHQPDVEGCTRIEYFSDFKSLIYCWERSQKSPWQPCAKQGSSSAAASFTKMYFGENTIAAGFELKFKLAIRNPSEEIIEGKVFTGVYLSLQGGQQRHNA